MKKTIQRVGVLVLGALILAGSPMTAFAQDRSYTYNYDYWEDVQDSPDTYSVCGTFTYMDLGLDTNFKNPEGLSVHNDLVYVCDSGNNRIVELKRVSEDRLELSRVIDSFQGEVSPNTFSNPTDLAVSEAGEFYICDKGNGRILKLDQNLNYMMEFTKPDDSSLDSSLTFQPSKLVIDTAGRVYCTASGINKGLIKYEADGTFSGFVGATKASYDWTDYIWKRFATQEQRAKMVAFVPTEYDNVYMDYEGFIYACTSSADEDSLRSEDADAVRKLNLMGNDILVRNGNLPIYGDRYWGYGGGHDGPSQFTDVTTFDNDIYVCLDKNRGRLFGYDDQGRIVYIFGSNGNMEGYFNRAAALEHMDYDLLVLDSLDCSITLFVPTEFGSLIYQAIDEFDQGNYVKSGEIWQKVMDIDGNYDLAYIGIGRSLLRQEKYHEAMKYFELKYDDENYSKAYKQYRKEWVEEHIVIIVIVILALFLIPLGIGKIRRLKYEIDTADIFKV